MGYTHYWILDTNIKNKQQVEKNYQKAISDCHKIILWAKKNVVNLSGYSAHTKLGTYNGIKVNGVKEDGHETFYLLDHFYRYGTEDHDCFNFCKTNRKEYDIVVVACLSVLKHRLKDAIKVSSDGDAADWLDGINLARKVTNLKIHNPIGTGLKLVG